jgi:serine phosphatase RsbU (regulator of sigma subunit)
MRSGGGAVNRIMAAAQTFAAGTPQYDDMTVVILWVLVPTK